MVAVLLEIIRLPTLRTNKIVTYIVVEDDFGVE